MTAHKSNFVHLHTHSEFSLLDGACRLGQLVDKAKKMGMKALALTDHGVMYGVVSFYEKATAAGIRPIIGCEVYLAPRSRQQKAGKTDSDYSHLTLLVKNEAGYKNLLRLTTLANLEGFYYKPRVDKELLAQNHDGLICLSGCLKGKIITLLLADKPAEAKEEALWLKDLFGEDFYLEIQNQDLAEQKQINAALIKLSRELNIPLVATNDVHYLDKQDAAAHDVLLCIQTGKKVEDVQRLRFRSEEFYFKSAEEMAQLFPELPEALNNTWAIAQKCAFAFELGKNYLPDFPLPQGRTALDYLTEICWAGLKQRYGDKPAIESTDRLKQELAVVAKTGFASYFLIVWDLICFAKERGIPVGPGRGSAAGSLIAYVLGITEVDPLANNLLFERFLNSERVSMPDIDMDFCEKRRGEVLEYVSKKYGQDRIAQIVTFGTLKARAAVRDVGRAQGVALREVDRIAKMIDPTLTIEEAIEASPELKAYYQNNEKITQLLDTAKTLQGLPRHASTHAAGVVIAAGPLVDFVPLQKNEGVTVTQYPMEDLQKIGLLKMDFLGLRNLTVMAEALKIIASSGGPKIDLKALAFADHKTYDLLTKGETSGVFQLESPGMRGLLRDLKPNSFADLTALLALYRPGPLQSGMVKDFIDRRHGRKKVTYEMADLEPILKETYGIILYQEQVMQIASNVAGFTLAQADLLRRAMSKKKTSEMKKLKEAFIEGAVKRGVTRAKAVAIMTLCEKFAEYGFNKSHSAAYAVISYQTAYLKAHWPVEFMAALLSSVMDSPDKVPQYVAECRRLGIAILGPDINQSQVDFTAAPGAIRFGLAAIKNVGEGAIASIVDARTKDGPFKSLLDLVSRIDLRLANKRVIEGLIKSGALDGLSSNRLGLLNQLDRAMELASQYRAKVTSGQTSLFGGEAGQPSHHQDLTLAEEASVEDWPRPERLALEKAALGLFVSDHPLNQAKDLLRSQINTNSAQLKERQEGRLVKVGGIVTQLKKRFTKQGQAMATFILEDLEGVIPIVVFPAVYEKRANLLSEDGIVVIEGKVGLRDEVCQVMAEKISSLTADPTSVNRLHIELSADNSDKVWGDLKNTLQLFHGSMPVYLHCPAGIVQAGEKYRVAATSTLISGLEEIVGRGKVWLAPSGN